MCIADMKKFQEQIKEYQIIYIVRTVRQRLIKRRGRKMEDRTYWNEKFTGECKSGFFMRCNLFEKIKHFEEMGYKVVGITVKDSWNIEFICEEPKNTTHSTKTTEKKK